MGVLKTGGGLSSSVQLVLNIFAITSKAISL
jgi:hypothetical protein